MNLFLPLFESSSGSQGIRHVFDRLTGDTYRILSYRYGSIFSKDTYNKRHLDLAFVVSVYYKN